MNQIFGNFQEDIISENKLFTFEFFVHSIPVARRKQTRYLSIAFITDYLANLFPVKDEDIKSYEKHFHIKSAISYIANELLENSMKFHQKGVKYPIKLGMCLVDQQLVFVTNNCVSEPVLENFKDFIQELITYDSDELYFRQLEKGAEEKSEESRLGFLSMMNDYSAKLGWKIETVSQEPRITTVTTMVQLTT